MPTLNTILKELKNVPVERLEDLYAIILSMRTSDTNKPDNKTKEILSYAGSFSDMEENDYHEFVEQTRQTRTELFDRNVNA